MFAWAAAGVTLVHNSASQHKALPDVPLSMLEPGDLVFYGTPVSHVGLYIGDGTMIEAPHTGVPVREASIWRSDLVGAGRPG
jgi:cell wall-associated NlpC family hydrolase